MKFFYLFIVLLTYAGAGSCYAGYTFNNIKSSISANRQAEAAKKVIERLIPENSWKFKIKVDLNLAVDGKDQFIIKKKYKVDITASSGVAAVWGFHYYIKNYCNCHIGWQNEQLKLPENLPYVDEQIVAQDRFRYYQNVCTTSYSFVWWNKKEWQKHIDWMALNGINLALASNGQEAIWKRVYQKLNLTDQEIDEHFSGPAFLSWQRMGNMRGWGGPLSENWHKMSIELQHFILNEMDILGITPVLPSFSGQVPRGFLRLFPDAKLYPIERWNDFKDTYCCPLFLDPTDPLFKHIGKEFLTEMINEFGTFHVYNSDPFNEFKPPSDDENFLKLTSESIYQSMESVDENAIWLLQNWMFVHDPIYWLPGKVSSFLTAVPLGKILILDLQSEQWPKYDFLNGYYGQPFIWCMLHNFGGTLGMLGSSEIINERVYSARSGSTESSMVGIGLTPEGINQNYVIYDFMLSTALQNSSVDILEWAENYAIRRYGSYDKNAAEAWKILMTSVYNYKGLSKMRGKYVITRQPRLTFHPWAWYTSKQLLDSMDLLLKCNRFFKVSTYRHDIVDLARQLLQYRGDQLYPYMIQSFKDKNVTSLREYGKIFLNIFDDLESLLASNKDFLLGNWIDSAKSLARSTEEAEQYEFNARNQITLWGPNGEIEDYAIKQWSGVVSDFLGPRWVYFFNEMEKSIINKVKFNRTLVLEGIFKTVEQPFTKSRKIYPTTETGDVIHQAFSVHTKWSGMDFLDDVPIKAEKKLWEKTNVSISQMKQLAAYGDDYENNHVLLIH